jgi:hypothetical protein
MPSSYLTYRHVTSVLSVSLERTGPLGSGYNIHQSSLAIDGNKRLAQLGDAIMKLAVLGNWYASASERCRSA